jgi:hypothetical protein
MTDRQRSGTLGSMTIRTPWGVVDAIAECGSDGRWYAVLRDPPPPGLFGLVGSIESSEAEALAALSAQCQALVRQDSA